MQKLTPRDELDFLRQIYGHDALPTIFGVVRDSFAVLQTRGQLLLGLITICLTITGFSGHRIASSGVLPKVFVLLGVLSVLASALLILCGPLQVRWMTQSREDTIDETLVRLIERRNRRTRLYHAAVVCLLVGLTGYVLSFAAHLLTV